MKKLLAVLVLLSATVPAQAIGIAKQGVFSSGGTVTANHAQAGRLHQTDAKAGATFF